ncbi:hypothetical protein [Sphingomonas hengshuiensis]|uniref:Uncharacterized protein n=1 Tax=Sphingomonas hengshuiensis TaxID=1609977 RepID=A0A7U5BEJ3_9SPHN|nr:hypothetical protein [Sphingomonas hengshuiensis]AJP70812.1 hypothetical protein TS85_01750 [Sphingomonas hengshuiensis]
MRLLLAASALLLAAAPGTAGQRRDTVPEATPAGKPVSCLRLTDVRESIVRDGQTIDFVTRGGKVYRNTLDGGKCPGLDFERRFLHKTSTGDLCSVDIITVLNAPGIQPGASCGLGPFQPVTLAKK